VNQPGAENAAGAATWAVVTALAEAAQGGGFSTLGASREGRPILGRLFGGPFATAGGGSVASGSAAPAELPKLLLVGGVHGDEPSSVEALLQLAKRFSSAEIALPPTQLMVVPALNPDGLTLGQKNASSDVDLNRNFPARNFTVVHAPGYDPGPAPLSEPETAWLARLIEEKNVRAVVAVHAPFGCINFDGPAAGWAAAVAHASGWLVRENIGYPTPGSLGSWLGVDRNLPILTVELPAGPLRDFQAAAAAALEHACAVAPVAEFSVAVK